jgi:hypothetical protein
MNGRMPICRDRQGNVMSLGRALNTLLILVAFLAQLLLAQAARTASETELKAAFVYNFA